MSAGSNQPVSPGRRKFLISAPALGLGVAACSTGSTPSSSETVALPQITVVKFDLTKESGALEPDEVVKSACQFCNSLCGIQVLKKSGRIIGIRGEAADPVAAGNLCVKADLMPELVYNPRRIKTPLKRVRGRKGDPNSVFEPVSWDAALDGIARKLIEIRGTTGPQGVANKTSGRMPRGVGSVIGRFFALLGSPNDTDVGPVCNDAGGNALAWTFGLGNFTNGYGIDPATGKEDLGASDFFFFLGTNQAETHPVTFAHLLRCRQKTKATLVVVDPRKTPTAAYADQWLPIRPHTDMALALGMLSHIVERGLYDKKFVAKWVEGFDELAKHLKDQGYTPAWAAQATGLRRRGDREASRGLRQGQGGLDLLQRGGVAPARGLRHLPDAGLLVGHHGQHRQAWGWVQLHAQHLAWGPEPPRAPRRAPRARRRPARGA